MLKFIFLLLLRLLFGFFFIILFLPVQFLRDFSCWSLKCFHFIPFLFLLHTGSLARPPDANCWRLNENPGGFALQSAKQGGRHCQNIVLKRSSLEGMEFESQAQSLSILKALSFLYCSFLFFSFHLNTFNLMLHLPQCMLCLDSSEVNFPSNIPFLNFFRVWCSVGHRSSAPTYKLKKPH